MLNSVKDDDSISNRRATLPFNICHVAVNKFHNSPLSRILFIAFEDINLFLLFCTFNFSSLQ